MAQVACFVNTHFFLNWLLFVEWFFPSFSVSIFLATARPCCCHQIMLTTAADIGINLTCSAESASEGSSEGSDANSQSVSIMELSLSSSRLIIFMGLFWMWWVHMLFYIAILKMEFQFHETLGSILLSQRMSFSRTIIHESVPLLMWTIYVSLFFLMWHLKYMPTLPALFYKKVFLCLSELHTWAFHCWCDT